MASRSADDVLSFHDRRQKAAKMKPGWKKLAIATLAAPATVAGTSPVTVNETIPTPGFRSEVLAVHAEARAEVGLPALTWNADLAVEAAQYAQHLATTGKLEHASFQDRNGHGENLWRGTRGHFPLSFMLGTFGAEKRHFKKGEFPSVSTTGNWLDVGHYTQIIWPDTTEVGCAVRSNRTDDYLVCRYAPTGNVSGTIVG